MVEAPTHSLCACWSGHGGARGDMSHHIHFYFLFFALVVFSFKELSAALTPVTTHQRATSNDSDSRLVALKLKPYWPVYGLELVALLRHKLAQPEGPLLWGPLSKNLSGRLHLPGQQRGDPPTRWATVRAY